MNSTMIAPCGMNCAICLAHLRDKNVCDGCWSDDKHKPNHCVSCSIKSCDLLASTDSTFCYDCSKYPCNRLKQLDKRYRTKYKMSMIENLNRIKDFGLIKFIEFEFKRWTCNGCGELICVHRGYCLNCNK